MDFVCGYCGKEYKTVEDRMECEKICRAKKIEEEKKCKSAAQNEEMRKDYDALVDLIKDRDRTNTEIEKRSREFAKKYTVSCPRGFLSLFGEPFWWM